MNDSIKAYHNVAQDESGRPLGMLDGYAPGHPVVLVFQAIAPEGVGDLAACENVFRLLNVGEDPEFGEPDPAAIAYRARGNRSLSVGDLVSVGDRFYQCGRFGWTQLDADPVVVDQQDYGTTPLRAIVRADQNGPSALNEVRALIVEPNGSATVRYVAVQLAALNKIVGGYLEAIAPSGMWPGSWHAYINEEGKLHGLPSNRVATALAKAAGWSAHGDELVGPAVFLGTGPGDDEEDGDAAGESDVPELLIELGTTLGLWLSP